MIQAVVFDWGDTVMRNLPYPGPMSHWPEVAPVPGIGEALTALRPRYRLALATNAVDSGAGQVRAALARVGLDAHFEAIFTAREMAVYKPAPAFYRTVVEELGCAPGEVAMVGDDYRGDVAGPKAVALRAIWYNPARLPCPLAQPLHDGEVRLAADLPAALESLHLPDLDECLALMASQEAPPPLLQHARSVAAVAFRLAERLRAARQTVDPLLAHRGGLLHDLDKVTSRRLNRGHGELGAELLRRKGQTQLAGIAERHLVFTILDPTSRPTTWEEKLVYYADKIVEGSGVVSVPERLAALCCRYPENAERMRACLPFILDLEAEIGAGLGLTPPELQALAKSLPLA